MRFDRLIRQQKWNSAGTREFIKSVKFDPFDRTSWHAVAITGNPSVSTRFVYLGLQDQVAAEEQTNTAGTYEVAKVYTHGAGGEKLALVDTPVNGTSTKKHFYGVNPHGDVETLTDATTGETSSTYRYTAYGSPDKKGTLGEDAITDDPVKDADTVNPYRFNSKRFDGATGTYDMGFREYDPGLNRYLTRDMYNGALNDLALGADPWNTNRYAFAGGNPITGVELDGHTVCLQPGDCGDDDDSSSGSSAAHDTAVGATGALIAGMLDLLSLDLDDETRVTVDLGPGGRAANRIEGRKPQWNWRSRVCRHYSLDKNQGIYLGSETT